jgi:hypothetical protein
VFSGEWIDRIIGLENVTVEVVMARTPDGSDMFEVVRFHSPSAGAQELAPGAPSSMARSALMTAPIEHSLQANRGVRRVQRS